MHQNVERGLAIDNSGYHSHVLALGFLYILMQIRRSLTKLVFLELPE